MPEISNRVSITVLPIRLVLLYSISFTLSYLNRSIWYFIYYWISIFKSSELKICQDLKSQVAELQNHKQSVVYHRTFVGHTRDSPQSITKNKKNAPEYRFRSFLTINCCKLIVLLLIFHLDISIWFHWNDRNFGNAFQFWASKHFFPNF